MPPCFIIYHLSFSEAPLRAGAGIGCLYFPYHKRSFPITLYKVKAVGDSFKRLKSKRKITIVYFAYIIFLSSISILFSIIIFIKLYTISCCQLIFFTISCEIRILDDAEPALRGFCVRNMPLKMRRILPYWENLNKYVHFT